MKYKTPEERKALCESWIKHIGAGYSAESFPECDYKTFQRYVRDFPEDFPADLIAKAKRGSKMFWEKIGVEGTIGQIKGFNAKSWEFNMKNRFGWRDKQDLTTDGGAISFQVLSYGDNNPLQVPAQELPAPPSEGD